MKKLYFILVLLWSYTLAYTQGHWQWATTPSGAGADMGSDVATDKQGNVFVMGTFTGTIHFDTVELVSFGKEDVFLAKYDPQGNFLWAKSAGGPEKDNGRGGKLVVDSEGSAYIGGTFIDSAHF